ncbi:calcium-binding protein [Tenggerimyces flavus]|uniref:Calcium-binding protein n=1 Tax=Tenggerimyces flavus TaxID=1708749 RepID=A0ABV7YGU0_9ACTN|nr:calcium-binding protein [Tenggerimyces flavus]MBM7789294.1 Ca2+-binding RTX toxin-like protein [Tenggerimyces flavus]
MKLKWGLVAPLVPITLCAAALVATPAYAASGVTVAGSILQINAQAGKANKISVQLSGTVYTVTDNGDMVTPGTGCVAVTVRQVRCNAPNVSTVTANLGDGNDVLDVRTVKRATVNAGAGVDQVLGSPGADIVDGGADGDTLVGYAGQDRLTGGTGNDTLEGGTGNDTFDGGLGADKFVGGTGTDLVTYGARTARVVASLDGVANDGQSGEKDLIGTDVERLIGGSASDQLTGSALANQLDGGTGDDDLYGLGGVDVLNGGQGSDILSGGSDNDRLDGGPGADKLGGGLGRDQARYNTANAAVRVDFDNLADDGVANEGDNVFNDVEDILGSLYGDHVIGSAVNNTLDGYGGNDVLSGGDGADTIWGGPGRDNLRGGSGNDFIDGEADNDKIFGDYGADSIYGGSGDDTLRGGQDCNVCGDDGLSDSISGGVGIDVVEYYDHTVGVKVSLDSVANDGAAGEKDNARADLEHIAGTLGAADILVGNDQANILLGFAGNDTLIGLGGDDILDCGEGLLDQAGGGDGFDTFKACETAQQ